MKIFLNIQFEHVPQALTNTLMHLIDVRIFLASKINVPNEARANSEKDFASHAKDLFLIVSLMWDISIVPLSKFESIIYNYGCEEFGRVCGDP